MTVRAPFDAEILSVESHGQLTYIASDPPGKPVKLTLMFASAEGTPANKLKSVPFGVVTWRQKLVDNPNIWAFLVTSPEDFD